MNTSCNEPPRARITLTFLEFYEDGETCYVEDSHGVRAELPLSAILQDAPDGISTGDTVPCDVPADALEGSGLTPDDAAEDDVTPPAAAPQDTADDALLTCPHDVRELGRETIDVTLELTDDERLELAQEMAAALAERDRLEAEFAAVKKDYKARIDLEVSKAAEAGAEFRAGQRTMPVSCLKFEDRTTMEIVYNDSVSGREVYRREMTAEERRLPLPLDIKSQPLVGETEQTPADITPFNARTCINCGHFVQNDGPLPEPCQTCSRCNNGDTDNWTLQRECRTCVHKTNAVDLYPCKGCALNAHEATRGDEDRWTDDAADQRTDNPQENIPPASPDIPETQTEGAICH